MVRLGVVVLACVISCGGDGPGTAPDADPPDPDAPPVVTDPPDAQDRSGTRLKRKLYVTPDGLGIQYGWHDALLGADCAFRALADGSVRCTPGATMLAERFRDAACTDRVLWSTSVATTPALATSTSACAVRYWRDLQVIAAPSPQYLRNFAGDCVATTPGSGTYFSATEVPATDYVAETIVLEPLGARLMAHVRTTDDGARELRYLYDPDRATGCRPDRLADGEVHCAPHLFADSGDTSPPTFADAGCSQLVRGFAMCERVPTYRVSNAEPTPTCGRLSAYAPITPHSGALFRQLGMVCEATTPTPGLVYGAVAAPLDASEFVAETARVTGDGATRVRRYYSVFADGSVGRRGLWDTVHDVECELRDDRDQVERCQPADYLDLSNGFEDPACTVPLADASGDPCPAALRPAWARVTNGVFHRVTGEYTAATAYVRNGASCTQAPVDIPLFTLDPVPVTDWEGTTATIEP